MPLEANSREKGSSITCLALACRSSASANLDIGPDASSVSSLSSPDGEGLPGDEPASAGAAEVLLVCSAARAARERGIADVFKPWGRKEAEDCMEPDTRGDRPQRAAAAAGSMCDALLQDWLRVAWEARGPWRELTWVKLLTAWAACDKKPSRLEDCCPSFWACLAKVFKNVEHWRCMVPGIVYVEYFSV
eukprot:CAMPEP_0202905362 /NCGR_PEP_ID=MMETSP1392-20130828/33836_1 /ASSEMBLY_ACC=CAM_ASM_000868 /TAXON_ID=225041 /ORGANISM="Chlamydomonas chlamydogama, Strain SAG 11-48b" /LENGTH=189 /DNA_ID=CAMNT_0049593411 /DNA_START=147 /DNA_END=716 /DNA_ORIENTATION=+